MDDWIGPEGVLPDLTKLTAKVDWDKLWDTLNLSSFLGLISHFRDLVKNYARLEQPLWDLIQNVELLLKNHLLANHDRTQT